MQKQFLSCPQVVRALVVLGGYPSTAHWVEGMKMAAEVRVHLTGYQMLSESFFYIGPFSL